MFVNSFNDKRHPYYEHRLAARRLRERDAIVVI